MKINGFWVGKVVKGLNEYICNLYKVFKKPHAKRNRRNSQHFDTVQCIFRSDTDVIRKYVCFLSASINFRWKIDLKQWGHFASLSLFFFSLLLLAATRKVSIYLFFLMVDKVWLNAKLSPPFSMSWSSSPFSVETPSSCLKWSDLLTATAGFLPLRPNKTSIALGYLALVLEVIRHTSSFIVN